ncbi:tudor domain-containing protein 15 [Hoplias malabaricus]|uniref:tudor domain-containing protein 15 n=1 Tax=Hoplias malabaricus TaxID=27720 RepID=UPI00346292C3
MLLELPIQQNNQSVPDLLIEKQTAPEVSFISSSLRYFNNILPLIGSKLVVGQKDRVRITAAANPGLFYCQLSFLAKDLKEMSEKLEIACESLISDCSDKPVENLGVLCAVKGKDEKWHRGFVQCLPVNSKVRVIFVDYGYCESVKVEDVLQLPSDFLLTPIMTYPCSLTCLWDQDDDTKNQQLELLRKALLGTELDMSVDGFSKEQNVFSVTLSSFNACAQVKPGHSDDLTNSGILKNESDFIGSPKCNAEETKKMKASEDLFSFGELQDGSVFEGYVEHVQNPNDFWIRTAERNHSFEDMMNKLTNYFRKIQLTEEILHDPLPGALCCAMYEQDMNYYRAVVVDTLENGSEVFFIDFGNTEKVPSMLIKKLPNDLAVEPHFALNCSLANVAPFGDCWTVAASEYFRKATSNKALMVNVIQKCHDKLVVDLYKKGADESESITALMIKANMAGYWKCSLFELPVEAVEKKSTTGRRRCEDPCKSVSKNLGGKVTWLQHLNVQECVVERQGHTEFSTSKPIAVKHFRHPVLKPGSEISVLCSHFTSPSDFWCQNKEKKEDLDRLMKKLWEFYQKNAPSLQPHCKFCAVKLQQDGRWYRGCTLAVMNNKAEVILVDYGMVVKEKLENIRALMPEFFELEVQAFRCSMYNLIEPDRGNTWSKEACTMLKNFVSEGSSNLTCKSYFQLFVMNKGLCNVVDLQTLSRWASAYLVEKGVAVEVKRPKQLVPSAYPCSFVYSSFNIRIGSEELVYATHIVSPWEIYLQLDRNKDIIDELMERTTRVSEELLSQTQDANCGTVCLSKYFGDSKWYRSWSWPTQSSQHLNVFFVDYGNKQVAEKCSVLPIPQKAVDLLMTPMQALRCRLSRIPEGEHFPEVNVWLENIIMNKPLQAKFVAKDSSGHFICDLFDGSLHVNEKMKELFETQGQKDCISSRDACKDGMKVSSKIHKFKTKESDHLETTMKLKRKMDHCKDIQGSWQNFKNKPSKSRSPHTNPTTRSVSKDKVKEMHSLKHKEQLIGVGQNEMCYGQGTPKAQISNTLPKMSDLPNIKMKPGFRGVGFISHCESLESFFIQMENDENTILKIREELNKSLLTENMETVTSEINIGDVVAAKYDEDLVLYRAVVTSVASSDVLTVEFLDYGNVATVEKRNIHLLARHLLSYPRLSIPCTLSKPHVFEGTEGFIQEAYGKPLMVELVQNIGCTWEVCIKIFDPVASNDTKDHPKMINQLQTLAQHESRKELNATETTTKNEEHNHTSLSEAAKKEKSRMKEDPKLDIQTSSINVSSVNNKVVQLKTFVKKQDVGNVHYIETLKTKEKHKNANKCQNSRKQIGSPVKLSESEGRDRQISSMKETKVVIQTRLPQTYSTNKVVQLKSFAKKNDTQVVDYMQKFKTKRQCKYTKIDQDKKSCGPSVKQQENASREHQSDLDKESLTDKEDQAQHLFLAPVKLDLEYSGFAAAVTTPSEFYIVLEDLLLTMNTVSSIIEHLPEVMSPLTEINLMTGTGCLVMSDEKNKWCRAEIVQYNNISVLINLVDYGHHAYFPRQDVNKLKRLPEQLAKLPKITYPCLLRGIKPAEGNQWSDNAIVFFQECMCRQNLQIYFRQYISEGQLEVDIVTGNRNIAKELVDAGHACYIDGVLGIRFLHRLGHKHLTQRTVSNIVDNGLEVRESSSSADIVVKSSREKSRGASHGTSGICMLKTP